MYTEINRIVISGATGAIGMALIKKYLNERVEVVVLTRKNSKRNGRIPNNPHIHIVECNLEDLCLLSKQNKVDEIGKCDVFYHFAWAGTSGEDRNNIIMQSYNIRYAVEAVELAKSLGCHTFIGAGSQAEYGRVSEKICKDTPTNPENGYGIAKLCAGQMSRIRCGQLGMKHIWTRILSVYGPYDAENTMIMSTIRKLLENEVPQFTKGEQLWDYIYSEDAATAMFLLGRYGVEKKSYCIGSGISLPLKEFILQIRDAIDRNGEIALGVIPYTTLQVMSLCVDIEELCTDTGFEVKTSFEEGIKKTVEWARKNR